MLPPSLTITSAAYADPPPWAPAHGWRAKHHEDDEDEDEDDDERVYYVPTPQPVIVQPALPLFASYPHVEIACSDKPIIGTVIGGVAGGLIGNQFGRGNGNTAATIGGVLIGAIFGNNVGTTLSRTDTGCMAQALEYARPGTQVVWQEQSGRSAYSILPTKNFQNDEGQYCREYQANVRISGKIKKSYGTACRQPDGQWRIMN